MVDFNAIKNRLKGTTGNGATPVPSAPKPNPFKPAPSKPELARRSLFAGVSEARDLVDANYCKPGKYISQVGQCRIKAMTLKGDTPALIDLRVIVVIDDAQGTGHHVGDEATHYVKNQGMAKQYFLPSIRNFMAAAFGVETAQVTDESCEAVFTEDQAASGSFVEWTASMRPIKDQPGKFFTRVNFTRHVAAREIYGLLDDEARIRLFPDGGLEQIVAREEGEEQATAETPRNEQTG